MNKKFREWNTIEKRVRVREKLEFDNGKIILKR